VRTRHGFALVHAGARKTKGRAAARGEEGAKRSKKWRKQIDAWAGGGLPMKETQGPDGKGGDWEVCSIRLGHRCKSPFHISWDTLSSSEQGKANPSEREQKNICLTGSGRGNLV